jgi:hypothetical protein
MSVEWAKVSVELLQAVAWPLLIAGVVIAYRSPIGAILRTLAARFSSINRMSVGSLSFEIAQQARQAGNEVLAAAAQMVGSLSPLALTLLLRVPRDGNVRLLSVNAKGLPDEEFGIPDQSSMAAFDELLKARLIEFDGNLQRALTRLRSYPQSWKAIHSERDWYKTPRTAESNELLGLAYRLTPLGRDAADAVIAAMTSKP